MERETDDASSAAAAKFEFYSKGHKRMKAFNKGEDYNSSAFSANMGDGPEQKRQKTASKFIDCSDPFAIPNLLQRLDKSKFGSVTEEIEALRARRLQTLNRYLAKELTLPLLCSDEEKNQKREPMKLVNQKVTHLVHQSVTEHPVTHPAHQSVIDPQVTHPAHQKVIDQQVTCPAHIDVIDLDDDLLWNDATEVVSCIINIESDDEDNRDQRLSTMYQKVVLEPAGELPMKDVMVKDCAERKAAKEEVGCLPDKTDIGNVKSVYVGSGTDNYMVTEEGDHQTDADGDLTNVKDCAERDAAKEEVGSLPVKTDIGIVKSVYVGTDNYMVTEEVDHQTDTEGDLADIWKEMTFALECSKDTAMHPATDEHMKEDGEECDHSFVLKDDLGYVCRICGVIQRGIETIFEFIYGKGKRTTRTYMSESKTTNTRGLSEILPHGVMSSGDDLLMTEIVAHPRHSKQMKPHQVEGFNFLCSNLVSDDPGGCILAHAPGSGKTFMIISFMQSFLARYPHARPLVVLPKGILATWKKEFQTWQVEDIPLHDFYTSKAENRPQQLDVLKQWVDQKSILFLGYKQLSTIVCDDRRSKVAADCQDILLKVPTILILDEGHTPRNDDTDVLQSLARVQTPLKVVLSGTLYQNHVREVFNILNLVRPKFLKFKSSQAIVNRIMSRVQISAVRKQLKGGTDSAFFESVEYTLQKDENFKRKVAVIQDLREMTSKVLHYYKGDFLDELPGLVDFTVMLNLSARQKEEVQKLWKLDKFKRISVGSLLYMHPQLKYFSEKYSATGDRGSTINEEKIDEMLEKLDVRHGAKVKFFLNILGLCESVGEKLLVFSQFVQPLKLLERLSVKVKGWTPGKELFMITGDSNSEHREWSMERFNSSPDAKVFFGSIKACGEGISLVGASRILILDVHLNPSVTRQAIGRAFRPGQKRKVHTYRLVAADSPEEEDYITCFRKELIAKMWFEWNESCGYQDFEVKTVDVNECGDLFLESPLLRQDIKVLHER